MLPPDDETLTAARTRFPEHFARVRKIFEAAVERPPSERRVFLEGACGEDRALLEELEGMLNAEGRGGGFLDDPGSPSAPEEGRFPPGTVLAGRYRIQGLLGRGGMGEVYKAVDLILNQTVALKFLSPAHISEAALNRFRNEVRVARQVSHPNVCRVYDLGVVDGLHFLSMEYIDGEDLASLLRRIGRLPQDKAIEFTRKICAGLAAAHDRGVLHRDLKPANIMIDGRGQPRITDFGLAALAQEVPLGDVRSGTPAYMSPEQKAGKDVTTRSDIYSLGLVLHEMFTGKHRRDSQSSPSDLVKDLDATVERLLLRCLEEEPRHRPASALSVVMALPGTDPIAAALAAGETPPPEIVAASREQEGLKPRTAILLVCAAVASLLAGIVISEKSGPLVGIPLKIPPDAMADRAQQLIRSLGYTEDPDSRAYGYSCCEAVQSDVVGALNSGNSRRPPLVTFYYSQQSGPPRGLVAFPDSEPLVPGLVRISLDAEARLFQLEAQPQSRLPNPVAVEWSTLFTAAGLEMHRFSPTTPAAEPAVAADMQAAWTGTFADHPSELIRVEAASWRGRPVAFRVASDKLLSGSYLRLSSLPLRAYTILAVLFAGALIAAWRNLRSGRSDKRGGRAVVGAAMLLVAFALLLVPRQVVWLLPELIILIPALWWILYIATEPYVRRSWPNALISWSRLCEGRFRNPLVASHLLVGATVAEISGAVLDPLMLNAARHAGSQALPPSLRGVRYLGGVGDTVASVSIASLEGFSMALFFLMAIVLLRSGIRKLWLADVIAGILIVTPASFSAGPWTAAILAVAWVSFIGLLRNFGFLAYATVFTLTPVIVYFPLTVTGWMAGSSLTVFCLPIVVAGWSLWVILSARRQSSSELAM